MIHLSLNERLREALEAAELTQSDLAERMGISPAAVSQWLKGDKNPASVRIHELAEVLGVSSEWLRSGTGEGPQPNLQALRQDYTERVHWIFRTAPPDGGRDYGNPNLWTLKWDIDTLVRESGQNSLDAATDMQNGVLMEFRIIRLTGSALKSFLHAIKWSDSKARPGLQSHIRAAIDSGQKLGTVLRDGLEDLETKQELILLRVDDRGARGLSGPETGAGSFAALCRNNLHSDKGDLAGGSYGLGKAVFWRASRLATVLIHSKLAEPVQGEDGTAKTHRLIGRTDLSWHQVDSPVQFAGPGWFGEEVIRPGGARVAESVWDNTALAKDLYLDRTSGEDSTGTSILVVGFHDPSSDDTQDLNRLSRQIGEAVARNFWPALESKRLQVIVSTYNGHQELSTQVVSADMDSVVKPFVEAVRAYRDGRISEQLNSAGDVMQRQVVLSIPRRRAPRDPHREIDHEAVLLVRRSSDEEQGDKVRQISYFRGREMVVKYEPISAPGAFPFHAVVLCGEATGVITDDAKNAERFLRSAEPPAHDDWKVTPELKADYAQGSGASLLRFFGGVREEVRKVVRPAPPDLDEGPEGLRELLRLGVPSDSGQRPFVRVDQSKSFIDQDGRWQIQGKIRLPSRTRAGWRVTPVLTFAAESSGGSRARWHHLEVDPPCRVDGEEIIIELHGAREAVFRAISDPTSHPVGASECAVRVDLRNPRQDREVR